MSIYLLLTRSGWMFLALLVLSPCLYAQYESAEPGSQLRDELEQLRALVEQQAGQLRRLEDRIGRMQAHSGEPTGSRSQELPERTPNQSADFSSTAMPATQALTDTGKQKESGTQLQAGWDTKPFLQSADGVYRADLRAYTQFDYRSYQTGEGAPPNTFLMRRIRPSIQGFLTPYFQYKIQVDFAIEDGGLTQDMYLRVRPSDKLHLTFGQMKEPFSQEELRSDSVVDFVDRSMSVSNLTSGRTPGVMLSGKLMGGIFGYQAGLFNGKGRHLTNNNDSPDGSVRFRFNSWKRSDNFWVKNFIFGGAYTQGRTVEGTSIRGRTNSQSFTFYDRVPINGKTLRANGEFTWILGPAAIRAEYNQSNQARDGLGVGGGNLPGVVAKGYTAQVTYLLSGESKPESSPVIPGQDLFIEEVDSHGWGAWEAKFRYDNLQITDGTPMSNRADTFTLGANWYMNRYVRYLFDLGLERFKDPLRSPKPGDSSFFVFLNRIQLLF